MTASETNDLIREGGSLGVKEKGHVLTSNRLTLNLELVMAKAVTDGKPWRER
jgi:hypothetical protein